MSDRKYRQRGYQDEPRDREQRAKAARPNAAEPRAPGRQLQDAPGPKTPNLMASHEVFRCARCGNRLAAAGRARRPLLALRRRPPQLHQLRVVRHQRALGVHAAADRARRAEGRAERCTLFEPRTTVERQTGTPAGPPSARQAFDDLFK